MRAARPVPEGMLQAPAREARRRLNLAGSLSRGGEARLSRKYACTARNSLESPSTQQPTARGSETRLRETLPRRITRPVPEVRVEAPRRGGDRRVQWEVCCAGFTAHFSGKSHQQHSHHTLVFT